MQRMCRMCSVWFSLGIAAAASAACSSSPPGVDGGEIVIGSSGIGLQLLAGSLGGPGNADGVGGAAAFHLPLGVAVDAAGNVYVADAQNNTIRKITAAGVVTTLAGKAGSQGSNDGIGAAARFFDPRSVAVDIAGNVYVADGNSTIRKISASGAVTTLAGRPGMLGAGDGTDVARFNLPDGVAVDRGGNVYVADTQNDTIRKITADGAVSTLAGLAGAVGSANGTGAAARFNQPTGVAVDGAGNVYVADQGNATIRKVTSAGVVFTLAGTAGSTGSADGAANAARFSQPTGVTVDAAGNVYVADKSNNAIRKITPAGVVTTLAGMAGTGGSTDATGAAARFDFPTGVAVDAAGNVFVADSFNAIIRKVGAAGAVTTLAGRPSLPGDTDGPGAAARFFTPTGVAADQADNVFITDAFTIRKISPDAVVTTFAGDGGLGSVDGPGATAEFSSPVGEAVDGAGNLIVVDSGNQTIRKITPDGVVSTLAGSPGARGSTDGIGAATRFNFPAGAAVDRNGNIYVADEANSIIRKLGAGGVVTTLAGLPGMQGGTDGTGLAARFTVPTGIGVDGAGNIYVADFGQNTIRKITAAGVTTTLAGQPGVAGSADGIGTAAQFNNPTGLAVDGAGNVFVADTDNATIRKVTPAGVVTTVAGVPGVAGLVIGPTPRFAFPQYLAVVGHSLVITDNRAVLLLHLPAE